MCDFEMFGVDNVDEWLENVKSSFSYRLQGSGSDGARFCAMSMISDAQELMVMNRLEDARKTLNLAKYILSEA